MLDLKDVQRVHFAPGETIVIKTAAPASKALVDMVSQTLREWFPDNRVLVLGPDDELIVLSEGP